MNARISSPLVELVRGWDTLVLPEIGGTKGLGFWVSSSESLGNPGVVESLSVSELGGTEAGSKSGTEECSEATLMEVVVKVVRSLGSSSSEVKECNPPTDGTESGGSSSSDDLVVALETEEVGVEQLRIVLNKLN
jgi:hypothetical protein